MPSSTRTLLKYPFTRLHALTTFTLDAKSTHWPGLSRYSLWILVAVLGLSLVHMCMHLWLSVTLGRMPAVALGCFGDGVQVGRMGKVVRPVTYVEVSGRGAFSIGAGLGQGALVTSAWTPFTALAVLGFALAMHGSRRGMSNRNAAFAGFCLILSLTGIAAAGLCLNIDTSRVLTDVSWCWIDHARMQVLSEEREVRYRVRAAIGAVIGVEVACALLYILSAVHAARLNSRRTRRPGTRLQDLSPHGLRIVAAPRFTLTVSPPQHEAGITSETAQALRNPFEDPAHVLHTHTEQLDTVTTYQPSGAPYATPSSNPNTPKPAEDRGTTPSQTDGDSTPALISYEISLRPDANVSAHYAWLASLTSSFPAHEPQTGTISEDAGALHVYTGAFSDQAVAQIRARRDVAGVEVSRSMSPPDMVGRERVSSVSGGSGEVSKRSEEVERKSRAVDELSVIAEEGSDGEGSDGEGSDGEGSDGEGSDGEVGQEGIGLKRTKRGTREIVQTYTAAGDSFTHDIATKEVGGDAVGSATEEGAAGTFSRSRGHHRGGGGCKGKDDSK